MEAKGKYLCRHAQNVRRQQPQRIMWRESSTLSCAPGVQGKKADASHNTVRNNFKCCWESRQEVWRLAAHVMFAGGGRWSRLACTGGTNVKRLAVFKGVALVIRRCAQKLQEAATKSAYQKHACMAQAKPSPVGPAARKCSCSSKNADTRVLSFLASWSNVISRQRQKLFYGGSKAFIAVKGMLQRSLLFNNKQKWIGVA